MYDNDDGVHMMMMILFIMVNDDAGVSNDNI